MPFSSKKLSIPYKNLNLKFLFFNIIFSTSQNTSKFWGTLKIRQKVFNSRETPLEEISEKGASPTRNLIIFENFYLIFLRTKINRKFGAPKKSRKKFQLHLHLVKF